jgi:D-erythro-7,8-dihydroneopterin triphosphate epimerase
MKTDKIIISGLVARCIIGAWDEERREKQDVVIDLVIGTDLSKAAKTDNIRQALDYRALKKKVLRLVERSSYRLLEALAEAIAALCLKEPKVERITVKVEKPSALRFAKSVAVEITRPGEP